MAADEGMMKQIKKIKKILLIVCVLIVAYTGVSIMVSHIRRENYKLNDRQVAILKEMEMPTEWDELTNYQQDCIMAIEEMLEYLEKKYDKEFCYGGYIAENDLYNDKEELLAYAKGDNRETDCFGVRPTTFGYDYIYLLPEYEEKYNEQIKEAAGDIPFFSNVLISGMSGNKVKSTRVIIILSYTEEYKEVGNAIYKYLASYDEIGHITINVYDESFVRTLTELNWEDKLSYTEDIIVDHFYSYKNSKGRFGEWESDE